MRVNAKKIIIDGITFDSKHEGDVYLERKLAQRAGVISHLQCHVTFRFVVNEIFIGTMKPDFVFHEAGDVKVWDAKGFKKSKKTGKMLPRVNREFGLKCKLLKALFGLEVECV